jgi:hypothetical protein
LFLFSNSKYNSGVEETVENVKGAEERQEKREEREKGRTDVHQVPLPFTFAHKLEKGCVARMDFCQASTGQLPIGTGRAKGKMNESAP